MYNTDPPTHCTLAKPKSLDIGDQVTFPDVKSLITPQAVGRDGFSNFTQTSLIPSSCGWVEAAIYTWEAEPRWGQQTMPLATTLLPYGEFS